MEYKICLIGCGTVGQGLLEILEEKREFLRENYDFEAKIVAICDKLLGSLLIPEGINIGKLLKLLRRGRKISDYLPQSENIAREMNALEIIEECGADIVAELTYTDIKTAEPATGYIKKALRAGKHVVTSNKGPAVLFYKELKELAEKNNLCFRIEGTVMSGTPLLSLFETGLAGTEIQEIKGILNGTTNFILTKMEEEQMDYQEALALAQKLGYAEADPTADVEGHDACAKIVILSNVFMQSGLTPSDVEIEGITAITKEKIFEAQTEGLRYKLIAQAKRDNGKVVATVSPQKIPFSDPLAQIRGATNAVTLTSDLLGKVTIQGPGAGKRETAFAILSDLLVIHHRFR